VTRFLRTFAVVTLICCVSGAVGSGFETGNAQPGPSVRGPNRNSTILGGSLAFTSSSGDLYGDQTSLALAPSLVRVWQGFGLGFDFGFGLATSSGSWSFWRYYVSWTETTTSFSIGPKLVFMPGQLRWPIYPLASIGYRFDISNSTVVYSGYESGTESQSYHSGSLRFSVGVVPVVGRHLGVPIELAFYNMSPDEYYSVRVVGFSVGLVGLLF